MDWLNYWNKQNIWSGSDIWKKNNEIFFKKTSNIFNYNTKHDVLEIGSGNGDFAKKLSDQVNQVYCLDTSQEFIDLCKTNVANKNNVKILKLSNDYTNLSLLKNIKFSIIIANSVVQYYKSQEEIVELIKSVKKVALNDARFLIADIEVDTDKKKSYLKLIYNSMLNGYFISLIKMALKLFINKEYKNAIKQQPLLCVDLDRLIEDISSFVSKVTVISEDLTINSDRKHLLIQF